VVSEGAGGEKNRQISYNGDKDRKSRAQPVFLRSELVGCGWIAYSTPNSCRQAKTSFR
jgi:hypothetical protein